MLDHRGARCALDGGDDDRAVRRTVDQTGRERCRHQRSGDECLPQLLENDGGFGPTEPDATIRLR